MRSTEQLRGRLQTAWRRNRFDWLAGGGQWPLQLPIQPPSEAQAATSWAVFDDWVRQWRQVEHGRVLRVRRSWARLGVQSLPEHWCFDTPAQVADALNETMRWQRASARHARWCVRFDPGARFPSWPGHLARSFDLLADLDETDFQRLGDALAWLLDHPNSGLYLRQLPIEGIDSKWLLPRQRLLAGWLSTLGRQTESGDFMAVAGLRQPPERLRMRLLDPALASATGGLTDIVAPWREIAALPLRPSRVLVVENRDTGLALEPLPGTVAFMALGYRVDLLVRIPWLAGVPMAYWGDIDTHGLAILDRLRGRFPEARALLMEEATLLRFQHLCVREETPAAVEPQSLLPAEAELYRNLRQHRHGPALRLEQERLPWQHVWSRIAQWAAQTGSEP